MDPHIASVFSSDCIKAQKNRQRAIFTGASPTIFAAEVLNFCVRHGNRCFHFAIITGFS